MSPCRPVRVPGWRPALLLSLAVHGVLGLLLYGLACRDAGRVTDRVQMDVVAVGEDGAEECNAFLVFPSPPRAVQPVLAPAAPPPPSTPAPAGPEAGPVVAPAAPVGVPAAPAVPVRAGPGHGGTGTGVPTFFALPARAPSVVYVIDRSASMGLNGALAVARRELCRSLEGLPETARFQVVVYNRTAETLLGGTDLVPATPANVRRAVLLLGELEPVGGTDHGPALRRALALHADVIFYLTDADDLPPDLVRDVTRRNRGRSAIHAVELNVANRDRDDLPMHRLARDNRGLYQAVDLEAVRN